ncbi:MULTISPECIES: thioredoxin domain-containing protein [Natrialbaceae]|uniref:thioredoxin domain-containing protein n=1 Tax=Natrialbaceae TaxID=1644061 RepID=UPI00207C6ACB|nr:thioredoxin domain-containing protein [Natronococcus sp. CG52]
MNRRSFLTLTAGVGTSLALAGCTALFDASLPDDLEDVEPDADQLPTPTVGGGDVTVDVYEDFACPTCQEFQADVFPELEQRLLEEDEATYRHYDFPLPVEDESIPMANAARTVQAATGTGDEPAGQFFKYKRTVMDADDWSDERLADLAEAEIGIDRGIVIDGLEEETYYPTLAADWNRGDENGVDRTPTVLVDGEAVDDPLDADEIVSMVDGSA